MGFIGHGFVDSDTRAMQLDDFLIFLKYNDLSWQHHNLIVRNRGVTKQEAKLFNLIL
jgi:hypothetical protein